MNECPAEIQSGLSSRITFHEMKVCTFQHMKNPVLLEKLCHFRRYAIENTEPTISIQSNTLVMKESIPNTLAGALPKYTQNNLAGCERAHLATG